MSLVRLRGVTRTVTLPDGEDLHILRGVNLDVAAGEHVSIVGRSGTGKSTMLNIIGLLDTPTSGTYELDGVDTTRLSEGRRARMRGADFGFVFQQFNIFAARTAAENVEVPTCTRRVRSCCAGARSLWTCWSAWALGTARTLTRVR